MTGDALLGAIRRLAQETMTTEQLRISMDIGDELTTHLASRLREHMLPAPLTPALILGTMFLAAFWVLQETVAKEKEGPP